MGNYTLYNCHFHAMLPTLTHTTHHNAQHPNTLTYSPYSRLTLFHPPPPAGQRIVGGQEAEPHKYGYQALVTDDESFICGGAVVGDKFILTAAHCIKK